MSEPVLQVTDLAIALPTGGDRPFAVSGVSFAVRRGEIVCLVGESGSGKSVIAHATMGLLPRALAVTAGTIALEGEDIVRASAERLRALRAARMSMIFQEPMTALNPVMRCGDQIDEVLRTHTPLAPAERRAKILDIVREVHLPDPDRVVASYPHQLSGGQRQRIMIAMALVLEPALLIADEPTTALDVTTQAQILKLVRELQAKHGTGVLFITHDFGVVSEIADRVAVLRRGKLVEMGPKDEVLRRPRHPYTKMLIGSVPSMTPHGRPVDASARVILATRGLAKTYGASGFFRRRAAVRAAEDVNLEIRRGQTLGIVGESGSGKSTVARCIVRLVDPSAGEVLLDGEDIAAKPARKLGAMRRRVQIVFQDPFASLNPRMRVADILAEGMRALDRGGTEGERSRRIDALLEQVGLPATAKDRYPHEFSGGQRQRIAIARALAVRPKLIVADEPTSALDVSVQAQIVNLLAGLQAELGIAYLFITHNLGLVEYLAHEVAVMYLGRIVERGPAERVLGSPAHPYTQALLAAVPAVAPGGAALAAARIEGELPSPISPPAGCHFHPRCPQATAACRSAYPQETRIAPDHAVRCHLHG
ncbi:MAG: ABC transporter ATP-binding protein [Burkholderiales bacterium]|nr:ABC transporter ATP-binding protein [Burkholderiales bacterium]